MTPLVGDFMDTASPLGLAEASIWFDQLRALLTPRGHEALLLRYLFDLSDDQVASVMGISAPGVRTNVSRAIAALRTHPEVIP